MKKHLLIFLLFIISIVGFSQTVLFERKVTDTTLGTHGENLRNYSHFYIGFGFIAGQPDSAGSNILMGKSSNFVFGYRYKLKICKFYAIGYDLAFNTYAFGLKQEKEKSLPDTILHGKESFSYSTLGLSPYMRFNYGRRGNRIGNFIDLGAYGDWKFSARTFTRDKLDNGNIVKVTTRKLKYLNPFNYGALARIGFGRYVIYGYYRLSDIFKTSDTYKFSELPRITVGVQIGMHK